jgi:hypothetical protein
MTRERTINVPIRQPDGSTINLPMPEEVVVALASALLSQAVVGAGGLRELAELMASGIAREAGADELAAYRERRGR